MRTVWPEVEAVLRANPCFRGTTVIAEAGHWVQYEAAEDFNSFVAEVLGHPGRT